MAGIISILSRSIINCLLTFKEGKWCYYTLNKEAICDLTYFLHDICKTKENDEEKCCCCGK